MADDEKDFLNNGLTKEDLMQMINNERECSSKYASYIKDITDILIEETDLYERVKKIQNRLMMLQYDLGKLD